MKLPSPKAGDIFIYWGFQGVDENFSRILLLISDPEEIWVKPGQIRQFKYSFLHREQVIQREVELSIVLSACDLVRQGKIIWNRVDPTNNYKKFQQLLELARKQ